MALVSNKYSSNKLLGQIYTPEFVVNKILDDIGYNQNHILGKKIIDPACGDGRFLVEVAKRIIQLSPLDQLQENLEHIYGWDIDQKAIQLCIQNLNQLVEPLGVAINWNIQKIAWKIFKTDSIKKIDQTRKLDFDFIVGNPPYIRIQHLEEKQRQFIQNRYQFCKSGSTDLYIAFFELCEVLLSEQGVCGLITPNTYFYTVTAKTMRDYFTIQKSTPIKKITNYGQIQLFDNATTYSAITIFGKKSQQEFEYEQAIDKQKFKSRKIAVTEIHNQKIWQLSLNSQKLQKGTCLKDLCNIHVGVTTLCDKAYIFSNIVKGTAETFIQSRLLDHPVKIENALLRPIIKGSKLKSAQDAIKEYILFPYQQKNGKYTIIPEDEMQSQFPLTYAYFCQIRSHLDARDKGKKQYDTWYAFGRNQSLNSGFGQKIIFSPMNKKPNFIYSENEEATLYSGYFLKLKENPSPKRYKKLIKQLNSKRMAEYVAISSRDFQGGWKAYSKKVVEDFMVDL